MGSDKAAAAIRERKGVVTLTTRKGQVTLPTRSTGMLRIATVRIIIISSEDARAAQKIQVVTPFLIKSRLLRM